MMKILKAIFVFPFVALVGFFFGHESGLFAKDTLTDERNNDSQYSKIEGIK